MVEGVKILRIKYNGKLFDVFSDKDHVKHFLEVRIVDGKEKFYHPNLSDLVNLNLIYNTHDDIKYDKKKYKFTKNEIEELKVNYNKMKKGSFILSSLKGVAIVATVAVITTEKLSDTDSIDISVGTTKLKHNIEFDVYDIKNVSFDELRETLSSNPNMSDKYKNMVYEYISLLERKLPDLDLRILNANLDDLRIVPHPNMYIEETAAGNYNANSNTIEICTGYEDETIKNILFHELTHVMTTFNDRVKIANSKIISNKRIVKEYEDSNNYGESIDEGMTEVLTNYLISDADTLEEYYKPIDRDFIGYDVGISPTCYDLLRLTKDEYTLYDFVSGNINDYVKVLKKYDLDGIVDYLDTIKDSSDKVEIIDSYEFNEYITKLNSLLGDESNIELENHATYNITYTVK